MGARVEGIGPFQWVLKMIDKVTAPMKKITQGMGELTETSGILEQKWSQLKTLALGALGFYTLREGIKALKAEMSTLDTEWTQLANILGSDKLGSETQAWITNMTTQLPIAREQLVDMTRTARKFNVDVRNMPLEQMLSGALVVGTDVNSMFSQLGDLTQQVYINYEQATAASLQLTNSTKSANKILQAMNSTAWNSAERFEALASIVGEAVPDAVNRQKNSIEGLKQMLSSYMHVFKEALIGDPSTSGLLKAYKEYLKGFVEFFEKNAKHIKVVLAGIGEAIATVAGFFLDLGKTILTTVSGIIQKSIGHVENFRKDIILPFITWVEMIKIRLLALVKGFIKGFLESPVWAGWKRLIGGIVGAFKKLLVALGVMGPAVGSITDQWEKFGKIVGTFFSLWISFKIVSKIQRFVRAWIVGMRAIKIATASNPIGLLIVALTTVIGLMATYQSAAEKAAKKQQALQSNMSRAYVEETREAGELFTTLRNVNAAQEDRVTAFDTLKGMYPGIFKDMSYEKTTLDQINTAQKLVNESIMENIVARFKQQVMEELGIQLLEQHMKQQRIQAGDLSDSTLGERIEARTGGLQMFGAALKGDIPLKVLFDQTEKLSPEETLAYLMSTKTSRAIEKTEIEMGAVDANIDMAALNISAGYDSAALDTISADAGTGLPSAKKGQDIYITTSVNVDGDVLAKSHDKANTREANRGGLQ